MTVRSTSFVQTRASCCSENTPSPCDPDADAAATFLERNLDRYPCPGRLAFVEIETDDDLLALLTEVQQAGIVEVAFDMTSADQTIVRMLYTTDVLDLLQDRIAEAR